MKNQFKKWQKPKIVQLGVIKTEGGQSSHSEDYIKPNGDPAPGGRVSGAGS